MEGSNDVNKSSVSSETGPRQNSPGWQFGSDSRGTTSGASHKKVHRFSGPIKTSPDHVPADEEAPSQSPFFEQVRATSPSSLPPGTPPPAPYETGLETTLHREPINWLVVIPCILLSVQFVFTVCELSLAGWAYNIILRGETYIGNLATVPFLITALISGVVGGGAILIAAKDLFLRTPSSLDADKLMTLLDLSLTLLAFGFAWKEISLGNQVLTMGVGDRKQERVYFRGSRGPELKFLEAFVILLFLLKLFKASSCFFNLFKRHGSLQRTCISKPNGMDSC